MAKFDAGKAVDRLEYDFTAYDGGKGPIKEPTTGRVNSFFANSKALVHEVRQMKGMAEELQDLDMDNMSEEEASKVFAQVDEASAGAEIFQRRTVENIALLCGAEWSEPEPGQDPEDFEPVLLGGAPTFEELNNLPYRVLQAFSEWLVQQIQPKRKTSGTKR